jgi:amino-acid N-acetyltransferase
LSSPSGTVDVHDATVILRPVAAGGDEDEDEALAYVETLLERNDLPSAAVRAKPDCFFVARRDDEPVGAGGLEVHGEYALVRSVVVEQSARGEAVGTAICASLEETARAEGVRTVYLLTTTAPEFFAARGYERVERADVPAPIRQTTEFDELCPGTAVVMRRSL